MVIGNYLRPSSFLWTIGQKWLFTTLSLWYRLPYVSLIICKSGLLIFLWAELPCKTVYIPTLCWIKHPCSIRAWVPVSFSLFPANSLECRNASCSPAQASKTLSRRWTVTSPPRESAQCLHEQHKPCIKGFIGFLHKPRNISLFLSLFLIIDSGPPDSSTLKDLNRYWLEKSWIPGNWDVDTWKKLESLLSPAFWNLAW